MGPWGNTLAFTWVSNSYRAKNQHLRRWPIKRRTRTTLPLKRPFHRWWEKEKKTEEKKKKTEACEITIEHRKKFTCTFCAGHNPPLICDKVTDVKEKNGIAVKIAISFLPAGQSIHVANVKESTTTVFAPCKLLLFECLNIPERGNCFHRNSGNSYTAFDNTAEI